MQEPGTGRVLGNKRNCIESREQIPGCSGKGIGFRTRRQEDHGFSYRWQSEVIEEGDIEVRFEYDQWFDENGEWIYDVCFDDFRLRSFESRSRAPFIDVHTETRLFPVAPAEEQARSYEWRVRTKTEVLIVGEPPVTVTKQYWLAKGVGKVYEVGVEEEEFLLDWRIPRSTAACPTRRSLAC